MNFKILTAFYNSYPHKYNVIKGNEKSSIFFLTLDISGKIGLSKVYLNLTIS